MMLYNGKVKVESKEGEGTTFTISMPYEREIKEMLIDRARKNTDILKCEYKFMKRLKNVLEDYCRGKEINIKLVMLREFARDLGTVIDLYNQENFE